MAVSAGVGRKVGSTLKCRKMTQVRADPRRRRVCTDEGQREEGKGQEDIVRTALGSHMRQATHEATWKSGRVAWKAVLSQTLT